jgi:hypothetical protein
MHGYGEFYWNDGKKYFGYYEEDKKHGFGVFIWNSQPKLKCYIGFWEDGKQNGIGLMMNNKILKYGLWKDGERTMWFQGVWEMKKYSKAHKLKYLKLFEKEIPELIQIFLK